MKTLMSFALRTPVALAALWPACTLMAQCPLMYEPAVNYPSNNGPFASAIGDVNGDGLLDVVVGYSGGSVVSVYLNAGGGVLGPKQDYAAGNGQVFSIVLARLNADASPDIACGTNNGLRVLLNANGTFGAPTTFNGISTLRQVKAADFNNDGLMDIVAASTNQPLGAVVFTNISSGAFSAAHLPIGSPMSGVGVLDFDGDTLADILVSGSNSNGLHRFKGLGNGSFQPGVQVLGGVGGSALTLADVTGDGRPEGFIPTQGGATIHVILNLGLGAFTNAGAVTEPSMGMAFNVELSDQSGDGVPDLIVPLQGLGHLGAHRGLGGTSFEPRVTFPVGVSPSSVSVGDLNLDGMPDAVVTNNGGSSISVLLGVAPAIITGQPSPQMVRCGEGATFSVVAGSATTFSWQRDGVALANGGHYSGVDTATLTVTACTALETGSYDCVVGSTCQATSNPATLSLDPCGSPDFDGDGDIGTDIDIEAFFRVMSGGPC